MAEPNQTAEEEMKKNESAATAMSEKDKKKAEAKRKKLGKAQEEEEAAKLKDSTKNSKKVDELDQVIYTMLSIFISIWFWHIISIL